MQALFFFIHSSIEFIQLCFKALLGLRETYFLKSLKACIIILILTIGYNTQAQDTIFYENLGASATTVSVANYTGWKTGSSYTMSGTANIVHTATPFSTSADYSQASGNAPVVFNTQNGGGPLQWWEISGVNSTCYSSVSLRFGIYKTLNASNGSTFAAEYSIDGVSYIPLTFALPSGGGTAGWYVFTLNGLQATPNLRIRFTNNSTVAGDNYRIDDISLRGTPSPAKPTLSFDHDVVYSCGSARLTAATSGLNKAVKLDGDDDNVSFGGSDYFNSDAFTIELWANIKAYEPDMKIFDFGNGNSSGPVDNVTIHFPSDAGDKLRFSNYHNVTAYSVTSTTTFPFNRWVHIACVFDGANGYIYIDGILAGSGAMPSPKKTFGVFGNYLGKTSGGTSTVQPKMDVDELRIWSVARTAAEIQANMETNVTGTSGLRDYWRMEEGSGTNLVDSGPSTKPGTLAAGANWAPFSAPIGVTYSWSPSTGLSSTTGRSVVSTSATSLYYTVTATYSGGCTNSARVFVNTTVPGDPNVYGNGEWISYAYSGAGATYSGYYKESAVSFDSRNKWDRVLSPSNAPGYQGCVVDAETHTVSYKRTNFTPGIYQFVFDANDETAHLFINEVSKFSRSNSTTSETAWIGALTNTTNVHYRWRETGGSSYGKLTITSIAQPVLNPGVVAGNQTICKNGDPVAFTSTSVATGCSDITYIWQSSLDNSTWSDISGATASTYDPSALTVTTYYRRKVTDACNAVNYSNVLTVAVTRNAVSFEKDTLYSCLGAKLTALNEGSKKSIRLDGVNDHLTVPSGVYFSNGNFTIEGWVNLRSYANYNRLIDFGNGASNDNVFINLSEATTGKILFSVYQGATRSAVNSNKIIPLNQWVHIACVLNGTTGTIYLNGENVGSETLNIPNNVTRTNNYIGRSNWVADAYSPSDIDELRIWNVARTQAEIQTGMETQVALGTAGLTHYWKMDEGAGLTTTDAKSGVVATLVNSPTWLEASAPLDFTYSWLPTTGLTPSTGRIVTASPGSTTNYVVTALTGGCTSKDSIVVMATPPPGDPSVFGNNVWNAYAFTYTSGIYHGYYTENSLSFHSGTKWNPMFAPSNAPDYKGCIVPPDNHDVRYKRTNFTSGIYKIEFNRTDDTATLIIDGAVKFGRGGSSITETAWIGSLSPTSQVEVKWRDTNLWSEAQVTFTTITPPTLLPGTIAGNQTLCNSGDPVAFTNTSAATGCSNIRYQWQSSPDSSTWTDISGATSLTYDQGTLSSTTYYRRFVRDDCNASAFSNAIKVTVSKPVAPSGVNGSRCGTGTVGLSATGSTGTYRWYDVSSGGSSLAATASFTTPSISATTLYYVSSADGGGCESSSRTTVTATVNSVPAAPGKTDGSRCGTGTVNISASGSPATYNWYDVSSGGSSLATTANFTTPSISATTLYYVSAVSAQSCEGPRTTVTATVNTIPAAPGKTDGASCGTGTVNLSASGSPGTYNWYDVPSGGSSLATTANFTTPSISVTTLYYVSAVSAQNCEGPRTTVTATINTIPGAPGKTDGARCGTGTVALSASGSPATYNWYDVSSGGSSLATTANFTTPSISITTLYYVSAVSAQSCEGPRTTVTATINAIPAAPGKTDGARCGTGTVDLSASGSPATYNWYNVSSGGSSLATTANFTTPSISITTLYYVSAVSSQNCEGPRTTVTATVNTIPAAPGKTDGARCGPGTVNLSASGSPATYNWYDVSSGGSSLATTANFTTPSISITTLYYVSAVSAQSCEGPRTTVTATVNSGPAAPGKTDGERCGTGTVNLSASGSSATYNWYDVPSGGSSLATTANYTTPSISVTTLYYVSAVNAQSCEGPRTTVTATVNAVPAAPGKTDGARCGTGTVDLSASGSPATYNWYNVSSGGASLATTANFTTPSISITTLYYVSAVSAQSCEGPRTTVTATINTIPAAPGTTDGHQCGPGSVTLVASGSPSTYRWYDVPTGGIPLGTISTFGTPIISADKVFYVSAVSAANCEGPRASLTAFVHPVPSAPIGVDSFSCGAGTVTLKASSSPSTYKWYDVPTGGIALGTASTFVTPSINVTTFYYVSAVSIQNCEGPRTTVTATIVTPPSAPGGVAGSNCGPGTVNLSATGSPATYKWYDVSSGGISLATTANFTTPSIGATTDYFVSSVDALGCEGTRTTVTATIHTVPSAPSKADGFKCGPGTVNLSAAGSSSTYNWYDVSSGGTSLATTSSFTTPSISTTTLYYVSAVSIENCEGPRTTVTAEIRSVPANPTVTNDTVCVSGTATLTASGSLGGYKWYPSLTTEIALEALPTYSPFVNATTVYYVATENNGCESTRITATAFVSSPSDAGTLSGAQTVCQSSNTGVIQLTGYAGAIQTWEISNDGFASDKNVLAGTSDLHTYNNLSQTSHYRVIVKSGVCPTDTSSIVIITTEAPAIPGTLSGDASVPGGINSGPLSLAGHSGTILRWESSTDNFASSAFIFNNTVSHSYNNIFQTTKYRVVVKAGVCPEQFSNVVTITVSIPTIVANDTATTKMNKNYENGISVLTNDIISPLLKLKSIVSGTTLRGGTLNMDSTGHFSYQPPKDFTGIDQIQYLICDAPTMSSCLSGELVIIVGDTVVIYTSLTPNGDGINDTWIIDGIHLYPKNNIKIYNRWGDLVYQMSNYNNYEKAWKGEANSGLVLGGKELPEGTYFYSIELGDGNKPKSGYVVIKH